MVAGERHRRVREPRESTLLIRQGAHRIRLITTVAQKMCTVSVVRYVIGADGGYPFAERGDSGDFLSSQVLCVSIDSYHMHLLMGDSVSDTELPLVQCTLKGSCMNIDKFKRQHVEIIGCIAALRKASQAAMALP